MVSFDKFFVVGLFKSYIPQCRSSVDECIWSKTQ
jgi:hypothetical protein